MPDFYFATFAIFTLRNANSFIESIEFYPIIKTPTDKIQISSIYDIEDMRKCITLLYLLLL